MCSLVSVHFTSFLCLGFKLRVVECSGLVLMMPVVLGRVQPGRSLDHGKHGGMQRGTCLLQLCLLQLRVADTGIAVN